ncbi:MAG: hypothetical protein LQ348_004802 [Seirophora lacunosa]|nr:MAG: hypothetical protein LQ348_004802 [Seirophora lacunosa]
MKRATAPVIVRQPAWTASLAATASEYPFPPNLSLLPNPKRLKGNPVTMPPSVPSPVQLKVLSANAARKVRKTSLRRAIRLLKLIVGHFAKDCPNNPGGSRACRNCGEEGHIAKECEKPKNPATTTCRNCEQVGHFSKDCPEPRDWSKVKCNTCGEMGHTVKRCPQAKGDTEAAGIGGYDAGDGGDAIDGVDNINGDSWGGGAGVNTDAGALASDSVCRMKGEGN